MKKFADVDSYIAAAPAHLCKLLRELRALIKRVAPDAKESISYGMPAYHYFGPLVYFAGYQKHIGLYATGANVDKFHKELAPYKRSKGTIQLPVDKPLPKTLLTKILKLRVQQNVAPYLKQLAKMTKEEVLAVHGLGKSALPRLERALAAQGLRFKRS